MPPSLIFLVVAAIGLALGAGALVVLRRSEAQPRLAMRLAGPREVKVGRLLVDDPPTRTVRVAGRVRCADPLLLEGERLVAFQRDVEVRIGGRWRSIERMRETRSFELWDHDGSLSIDPALAAEPLIAIPQVWRGHPDALEEPHAAAVAMLAEREGSATAARAVTRSLSVTDRLLVLARAVRDTDGRVRLEPPEGGYLISSLPLDDAMRLLGGRSRRAAAVAVIGLGLSIALTTIGIVGALLGLAAP